MNWGKTSYAGFRESQSSYRVLNQDILEEISFQVYLVGSSCGTDLIRVKIVQ